MRRRSFFQRFAQFAAIVALAPQLAFRSKPLEFRPLRAEDFEWEFCVKILTVWDGVRAEKPADVDRWTMRWEKTAALFCLLCFTAHAQVIQITCPTRTVPGTYTNQTNAGYIVETVTTPVINGSQSHYYNSGITNLPNVFKNVPAECTIRTNYRQATLKVLRPRAIRSIR